ncbi:MAG TPA: hypothetical protein VLA97_02775, partial [Nocardioidaceae bacterium]|nr:hypothetical protein [Nocardioidaceae bacterium]
ATGCQPSGSGTPSYLTGGGYLRTTAVDAATEPSLVETCGVARAGVISILPTTFAPKGLVQLELVGASARCTVSGASHGAAATYDYKVKVRIKEPGGENDYYDDEKIIDPSTTDDLLAAVDLESPVSLDRKLGDYIASWSSLTPDRVSKTQVTGMAEVDVPGVVTLTTAPLRPKGISTTEYDEGSAMSVTIGAVSCSAKDAR